MPLLMLPAGLTAPALREARAAGASGIILDLASAAPGEPLEAARQAVRALLATRAVGGMHVVVRVAGLGSGRTAADLDAVIPARPDAILLPECRDGADVQHLGAMLAVHEAENGLADGTTRILAEAGGTPQALFALGTLPRASHRLDGLVFDAGGLATALGAQLDYAPDGRAAGPIGHARSQVLFAAAAGGLPAYEIAAAAIGEALEASARAARCDGFSGLIATDAAQIALIRRAFG